MARIEAFPGYQTAKRSFAEKKARAWRQEETRARRRQRNHPTPEETRPQANPDRYYATKDGRVIKGCQLAEGILPINVQEVDPPPWKTRVKVELRVWKEQSKSLFRRIRYS